MSLIEGIGDEVIAFVGIVLILLLVVVAWLSTHVSDTPLINIIILDRATFQRLLRRFQSIGAVRLSPLPPEGNTETDQPEEHEAGASLDENSGDIPEEDSSGGTASINSSSTGSPLREVGAAQNTHSQHNENSVNLPSQSPSTPSSQHGSAAENEVNEAEGQDGDMTIRIKYLDDRQKVVQARSDETIGEFKRKHFAAELAENLAVRFIFNGQELRRDANTLHSYNVQNNSVIHCMLSRSTTEDSQPQPQQPGEMDMTFLMFPLFGVILALIWYSRFVYRNYFNAMSTISLVGITFLYVLAVIASRRHHETHEHID